MGVQVTEASRRLGINATKSDVIREWIRFNKITHVINAAAECGGIGLNKEKPASLWSATTAISHGVLEGCVNTDIKKLVMIGTVCSYAAECPTPFREVDLMQHGFPEKTNAAYGVSKLSSYFGTIAYRQQYGMPGVFLIPVNMYGPNDNFDDASSHVIPAIIKKCLQAKENQELSIKCWGSGQATREFLYVDDAAELIARATFNYNESKPLNLGTGEEISIADLTATIAALVGYKGKIEWDTEKPDGQMRRRLDIKQADTKLGVLQRTSLKDGLMNTIRWYQHGRFD
jgi:GDP-L-fucose synthase